MEEGEPEVFTAARTTENARHLYAVVRLSRDRISGEKWDIHTMSGAGIRSDGRQNKSFTPNIQALAPQEPDPSGDSD